MFQDSLSSHIFIARHCNIKSTLEKQMKQYTALNQNIKYLLSYDLTILLCLSFHLTGYKNVSQFSIPYIACTIKEIFLHERFKTTMFFFLKFFSLLLNLSCNTLFTLWVVCQLHVACGTIVFYMKLQLFAFYCDNRE